MHRWGYDLIPIGYPETLDHSKAMDFLYDIRSRGLDGWEAVCLIGSYVLIKKQILLPTIDIDK